MAKASPLDTQARWRLSATLRGAAWQAAIARAAPSAALWVEGAERLDAAAAAALARAAAGRTLVLAVDAAALDRLALGRLAMACGARAVVARAPLTGAAWAAQALRRRAGNAPLTLGLELAVDLEDGPALAALDVDDLLAAGLHVALQPTPTRGDALPAGADDAAIALRDALERLPPEVRLGEGLAALCPGRGGELPGPRPGWIEALATAAAHVEGRDGAQQGGGAHHGDGAQQGGGEPRWTDAAEWIALELGLRRVWRLDLDEAMLASLERCAAATGMALLRGATVGMDSAGLWHADRRERWLVYVGPALADLREADRRERDTLSLAARGGDAHDVDPAADNDRVMARLLGYPDCCRDAFLAGHRAWTAADAGTLAEVAFFGLRAARATAAAGGLPDRRLDVLSPLAGATTIRHYPCRLDCAASLALSAAIDAEAWRRDPGRRRRDLAVRADATLFFASGAAIPLRGRAEGTTLHEPRLLGGRRSWAPHWPALEREVLPALAGVVAIAAAHDTDGRGGVTVTRNDGSAGRLDVAGGFPADSAHADFPRLLIFSADLGPGLEKSAAWP